MKSHPKSRLFSNKSYLWLIASQTVSALGDWLDILAVLTLVAVKWNASPIAVSGVMLCFVGPMILIGPLAGGIADRFDRKKIMIISDVICAVLVIGVALSSSLWQVYLLITLKSLFVAFFMPAKNGKLKEIVHKDDIQMAMSTSSMIDNGAKVLGPTLGGLLVASIGIQWAFYIDAITFILSAIFLIGVPKSRYLVNDQLSNNISIFSIKKMINDMKDGLFILKATPVLLISLFLFSFALLVLQIADTQFMVLARLIFEDPTKVVGFAMAFSGIGMFISSAVISKMKLPSVLATTSIGGIGVGSAFAFAALISEFDQLLVLFLFPFLCLIAGAAFGLASIPFHINVQQTIPVSKTGRVFGTIGSITTISSFVGMTAGGVLSQLFGVIPTFIISGTTLIFMGTIMLVIKERYESRDLNVT